MSSKISPNMKKKLFCSLLVQMLEKVIKTYHCNSQKRLETVTEMNELKKNFFNTGHVRPSANRLAFKHFVIISS